MQHLFVNFTSDKLEKVRTVNKLIHNTQLDSEVNNTDIIMVRQTLQINTLKSVIYLYGEDMEEEKGHVHK